jgi:hypothetical protein
MVSKMLYIVMMNNGATVSIFISDITRIFGSSFGHVMYLRHTLLTVTSNDATLTHQPQPLSVISNASIQHPTYHKIYVLPSLHVAHNSVVALTSLLNGFSAVTPPVISITSWLWQRLFGDTIKALRQN